MADKNRIIIVSQIPETGWHVPNSLRKIRIFNSKGNDLSTSYDVYKDKNKRIDAWLETMRAHPNIDVLDVSKLLCSEQSSRCMTVDKGEPLYRDSDHPAPILSQMITDELMRMIAK